MAAYSDLATDPTVLEELLEVRRATAFLARKINEVQDSRLNLPTLLDDWTRAHLIAHLGYNARALCRLALWANSGKEHAMYSSPGARVAEIERGATLQPHALRHLFEHSAISLNVEWRDTPDKAWSAKVRTATGRWVPFSETIWMRLREVWIHAIDLDNGARWIDIPTHTSHRLLQDIVNIWSKRDLDQGYILHIANDAVLSTHNKALGIPSATVEVYGDLPDLLSWASGRSTDAERSRLQASSDQSKDLPSAPPWL